MPHVALIREKKQKLVKQIWVGAAVLSAINLPMAVWRNLDVGLHAQLAIHFVACFSTIFIAIFRHSLPHTFLALGLILFSGTVGLAGIFTLGMTGTGFFWLTFCTFVVCLLYSQRAGMIAASLASGSLVLAGVLFINGILTPPFDLMEHVHRPSAWISFLLIATLVPFVMLKTVTSFQAAILDQHAMMARQNELMAEQQKELEQLARFDALTGLPTLRLAEDRLQMAVLYAQRVRERVAVLFIDLDGFKGVNDTYGHHCGDLVLKEIGQRLQQSIRGNDTVARIGGDEFIAVLGHVSDEAAVKALATKLIAIVGQDIVLPSCTLNVGASVGIAFFPEHGKTVLELKDCADKAMYCAKRAGKNQAKVYHV